MMRSRVASANTENTGNRIGMLIIILIQWVHQSTSIEEKRRHLKTDLMLGKKANVSLRCPDFQGLFAIQR